MEHATGDDSTCILAFIIITLLIHCPLDYIIEKEPVVNKFISVPKDRSKATLPFSLLTIYNNIYTGGLNCAAFNAGIVEGILSATNFVRLINLLILLTCLFTYSQQKCRLTGTRERR